MRTQKERDCTKPLTHCATKSCSGERHKVGPRAKKEPRANGVWEDFNSNAHSDSGLGKESQLN